MLKSVSSIRRNQTPTNSDTEVVGTKTRDAIEQDWLTHFKSKEIAGGRPGPEWMTASEMAAKAGTERTKIRRYVKKHPELYQTQVGCLPSKTGGTRATFIRFIGIPKVSRPANKRAR